MCVNWESLRGMFMSTGSINWENNGITHTVKSNSGIGILGLSGFGMEWGQGSNGIKGGSGFRVNLNPFDTMDIYNFSSQSNGMMNILARRNHNSGKLETGIPDAGNQLNSA